MKKIILLLLIGVAIINSNAQVNTKTFEKSKAFDIHPEFKISQTISSVIKMPKFDIASMLAEDEAVGGMDVPFRFGKGFDVNYTLKDGNWENTKNGRIWSIQFQSEGAFSINFIFSELFLPEGSELYIYNPEGTMVYGPVTSKQNLMKGKFLTDLVKGDAVTIHIFEPEKTKDKARLTISRVIHAYVDMYNSSSSVLKSATLNCHNNIDCYPNWEEESDGVALILLSTGDAVCSGSMVNNTANDYTPYILTAFHCLDGNETSWMFKFGFRENDCGGMNYFATSFNGSSLTSSWVDSDFALLEMADSPVGNGNIAFLGWDNRNNTPTLGTSIHHPGGDYMKISFDNNGLTTNNTVLNWIGGTSSPVSTHWVVGFDNGTAEGGSSGGPLFDQNSRVVGQLHGGPNVCPPVNKYYGRFDVSWDGDSTDTTQLAHWLDPNATGDTTTDLIRSPSITVPDVICYSGTTVSMQNPPSGVTINWGGTNVSYPSGDTGTSVTVRANSSSTSAEGTVTASFTVNGIQRSITHPVWVGEPDPDDFYVTARDNYGYSIGPTNGPFQVCPNNYYTFYLYPSYNLSENHHRYGITDIDFFFDFDYTIVNQGYGWAYIYVNYIDGNSYGLAYIDSECGGYEEFKVVNVNEGYCGYYLTLSPNPATSQTMVSIESNTEKEQFDDNAEWDMEVYSPGQTLKTKKTKLKGKSTTIQTAGWAEGVYTVRIKYKDQVLTGKLIVKK